MVPLGVETPICRADGDPKLLHYFTDHEVVAFTSYPLGDIIRNHDAMGWISKWALELMGHDMRYIPHTAIKS